MASFMQQVKAACDFGRLTQLTDDELEAGLTALDAIECENEYQEEILLKRAESIESVQRHREDDRLVLDLADAEARNHQRMGASYAPHVYNGNPSVYPFKCEECGLSYHNPVHI